MATTVNPFEAVKVRCGCTLLPDHVSGERLMYCSCGIRWVVSSNHVVTIDFESRPFDTWCDTHNRPLDRCPVDSHDG